MNCAILQQNIVFDRPADCILIAVHIRKRERLHRRTVCHAIQGHCQRLPGGHAGGRKQCFRGSAHNAPFRQGSRGTSQFLRGRDQIRKLIRYVHRPIKRILEPRGKHRCKHRLALGVHMPAIRGGQAVFRAKFLRGHPDAVGLIVRSVVAENVPRLTQCDHCIPIVRGLQTQIIFRAVGNPRSKAHQRCLRMGVLQCVEDHVQRSHGRLRIPGIRLPHGNIVRPVVGRPLHDDDVQRFPCDLPHSLHHGRTAVGA